MTKMRFITLIIVLPYFLLCVLASAKTLFEDNFKKGTDNWELIPGQGKIEIGKGSPPEYGPNVFLASSPGGTDTLAFVKDFTFTDGIIDVLWRDKEIAEGGVDDREADGPLITRMQAKDLTKGCLVEFDKGDGLHFDILGGSGVLPPRGPQSGGKWNWLRWRLEGDLLQVKFWEPGKNEPKVWVIEVKDTTYKSGFVGLRAWSVTVEAAYYRISDLDGPSFAVEFQDKAPIVWGRIKRY
ncbi:hypothetical protein FJZ31_15260 [Candidatus Poribacteria bacterium]|nr:hypothetical protein [Candidatus Poribacteria bacterium]